MHMNIQEPTTGQRMRRTTSQILLCALIATLSFVSCTGGGTGGSGATANTGQALISVTDAAGDFLSYAVNVQSLTLTKQDGAVVETLPLTTRINFADYVALTEFFTAATIPSGTYISARMRLDFSTADLQVEGATGNAVSVPVANIRDAKGNPITTLDVAVRFDDRRPLIIAPGIPSHLTLDFNLRASNTVDLTNPLVPVVTVRPFLVADVDPQNPKTMRLRGPLDSVNLQNQTYQVFLRPAFGPLGGVSLSTFGLVTVHTDTNTVFEIDQVSYQGALGLTALAAKPTGTATVAIGNWDVVAKQFKANEVLAGSSVPGGTKDVVTGVVIARSGDQLTVKGATLVRSDGTFMFNEIVTVNVGATTTVRQQALMTTGLTKEAISVGQYLTAFGTINVSTNPITLDATTGLVRLLVTSVAGTVNTTTTGSLQMTVQRIQGRLVSLFNFAGTGTSTTTDANPSQYVVATGALSLTGLTFGTPVKALGFVTPFGTAAPPLFPDFTAQTIVNLVDDPATLIVDWSPPTAVPFSSNTDAGLLLDLTGATTHSVWRGPVATDLLSFSLSPTIVPANPLQGLFAVGSSGQVQVFTQFHDYSVALQQRLAQGQVARAVGAHGLFSDSAVTETADQIYTVLE
jgi:hypothetical protein